MKDELSVLTGDASKSLWCRSALRAGSLGPRAVRGRGRGMPLVSFLLLAYLVFHSSLAGSSAPQRLRVQSRSHFPAHQVDVPGCCWQRRESTANCAGFVGSRPFRSRGAQGYPYSRASSHDSLSICIYFTVGANTFCL